MANEKRLIDANKLEERVKISDKPAWMVVRDAPTVDAVEVVHSWWEKSEPGYKICLHCKADVAIFSGHKNYCPNCGAKMDGERKDK